MNSERRHELQENELAAYLGRFSKAIEPYKNLVAACIVVAVVGGLGTAFYRSTQAENRSDATLQLMQAAGSGDTEVLASVATQYPDTPASAMARLYQADNLMARGMQQLFSDQQQAEDLFAEAEGAYQAALSGSTTNRLIRSRANYGLGRIAEARGKADEAIGFYEEVVAAEESEAIVEVAKSRIDSLQDPATKDFLAWFDQQEFTPPQAALPPSLPSDGLLPDSPDITFPEITEDEADEAMADDLETEDADGDTAGESESESADDSAMDMNLDDDGADEAGDTSSAIEMPSDSAGAETGDNADVEPVADSDSAAAGDLPAETESDSQPQQP